MDYAFTCATMARRSYAGIPAVCLAGLTRNSADFGPLASALAAGHAGKKRRVLALDYRGRGLSDYDPDWKNYSLAVENSDVLSILTALEIDAAIFIGTSRGGLHTMLLSATRPAVLRGAVLNDIGPVLEPRGMARIRGYVGKLPAPRSIPDAVDLLKEMMSERFNGLSEADWEAYAKITFTDAVGRIGPRYDQNLMKTLIGLDLEQPLPSMWPQFDGLASCALAHPQRREQRSAFGCHAQRNESPASGRADPYGQGSRPRTAAAGSGNDCPYLRVRRQDRSHASKSGVIGNRDVR